MSASAPVNRILPYSVVDGPGNRAAVFVQGCNIACRYCHNPETQRLCDGCGACVRECPAGALELRGGAVAWHEERCLKCDRCIQVCQHRASPKVRWMDADAAFAKVSESIPFIRGLTTSGGECSLYPDFLRELYALARSAGLSSLMDSNGTVELSKYPELMEVCDGVMLDVKAWDGAVFHALTGGKNDVVKRNLLWLAENDKLEEIRIVTLDGYVDAERVIAGTAEALGSRAGRQRLKLIRFRRFGVRGPLESAPSPTMERMRELEALARRHGYRAVQIV